MKYRYLITVILLIRWGRNVKRVSITYAEVVHGRKKVSFIWYYFFLVLMIGCFGDFVERVFFSIPSWTHYYYVKKRKKKNHPFHCFVNGFRNNKRTIISKCRTKKKKKKKKKTEIIKKGEKGRRIKKKKERKKKRWTTKVTEDKGICKWREMRKENDVETDNK